MFVFAAILTGCGDDDNTPEEGGTDAANTGGRGGAAGGDAARADRSGGGGASGGASDAGPDRSSDGQGGADVMADASTDGRSTVDADGSSNADSADRVDGDASSVFDGLEESGPQRNDASDAPTVDVDDGADGVSIDAARDTDASGSDAIVLDAAEASACDDGNAATTDFYHPSYGCGHRFNANPGDNDAWITYDAGFHVDVATGLGWTFPAGPRNATAAAAVCDAFSMMGLVEWRMPTIDDARSLAGGCAATALGGSCALDDPACLTTACGQATPACDACTGGAGPHAGAYCKVDVAICTHFHTSSICPDCGDAGAEDWIYAPGNGSFLPLSSLSGIPTACVSVVPNGVPAFDGG
ncbi:MAG TPA: hypothetical protein VK540_23695 [Polyangiaceae bacterium]|nr:hypothetical protein [Polyangiaceae bacterium]